MRASPSVACPVVGLPGSGPSQLWVFPVASFPVCGPPRLRSPRHGPSFLFFRPNIPQAPFWAFFLLEDSRFVLSGARRVFPAPFSGGRPVCLGRADGSCPLRRHRCQLVFERTAVALSRRCPYGAIFWTVVRFPGKTPVRFGPAVGFCPLHLLGRPFFLLSGRPSLPRGVSFGWAPSCLLGRTDGPELTLTPTCRPASTGRKPSRPLSCTARLPGDCSAATRFFGRAPVSSDGRIVASYSLRRLSCPARSRVYGVDTRPFFGRTPVFSGRQPFLWTDECQFPLASSRVGFLRMDASPNSGASP